MSNTPRADELGIDKHGCNYPYEHCRAIVLCRQLERELAAALDAVKRRDAVIEEMITGGGPHTSHESGCLCYYCVESWREWVAKQLKARA